MIERNIALRIADGFTPERVRVSQFDTMWRFVFEIFYNSQRWEIPSGATAVLNGRKPDGNVFAFSGTIEDNKVTVDCDVQMTAVVGQTVCELSVLSDGKVVGTANFVMDVEAAPNAAIIITKGSTKYIGVTLPDNTDTIEEITFSVKESYDSATSVIEKNISNGVTVESPSDFFIKVDAVDTESKNTGAYVGIISVEINGDTFVVFKNAVYIA